MTMRLSDVKPNPKTHVQSCLPKGTLMSFQGHSMTEETIQLYENKAWHFTFLITILAIAATYLTIAELKEVARSLE